MDLKLKHCNCRGRKSTRPLSSWHETMEAPVKGWLHKTRKGMMMKAAQRHRRWFVLEGTTLSWYVDDSETAETPDAKGSIDVRGATVETTKALQFNLEFATGRRDKLEAESQEDVNAWARVRARARVCRTVGGACSCAQRTPAWVGQRRCRQCTSI